MDSRFPEEEIVKNGIGKKEKIRLFVFVVICALLTSEVHVYAANACIVQALQAAKGALGNQRALKVLCRSYFGDALAKRPVIRKWSTMDESERGQQIDGTCNVVLSIAGDLAVYADAKFVWLDDTHAVVTLNKQSTSLTVHMAGSGCKMSDVCIEGKPCLSKMLSDYVSK